MKITDNLYFYQGREEESLKRGVGSSNVTVLKTDNQVMFDTGLIVGGAFKDLESAAAADGVDLSKTKAVLHTHGHWDHFVADMIIQGKYGATAYSHSWEKPSFESQGDAFGAMADGIGEFYGEVFGLPKIFFDLLLRYLGGSYKGIRIDNTLDGGEEIDFGLKVVACHTPGHTPGHMSYYIPEEKAFVGGDLIDLETGEGADLNNPFSNYADGLASLEKTRELDIEVFFPSHGEPISGADKVQSLLDRMIDNTHKYVEEVTRRLSGREGTLTEVFNDLMPGTSFNLKAMKMMQILTTLKHLEEKGEVTRETKDGKIVWSMKK